MLDEHFVLVEDRPEEVELIELALNETQIKHNFIWLKDGQEALDFFKDDYFRYIERTPSVIVLDLKLPKVSGIDVLQRLRKRKELNRVPIVVLTSSNREEDKRLAYENGANSYLVKSGSFQEFTSTIKDMSNYWLGRNQLPHYRDSF